MQLCTIFISYCLSSIGVFILTMKVKKLRLETRVNPEQFTSEKMRSIIDKEKL